MHRNVLTALLGLSLGVSLGEVFQYASEVAIVFTLIGVLQLCLYVYEKRRDAKLKGEDSSSLFSCSLVTFIFSLMLVFGILRTQFMVTKNIFMCESACTFSGTVVRTPEIRDAYQKVRVDLPEKNFYDVLLLAPLYPKMHAGEIITITGIPQIPKMNYAGVNEKNFNYARYLISQGIGSEVFYPKIVTEDRVSENQNTLFRLVELKEYFVTTLKKYVHEPSASLASGMLFGSSDMSSTLTTTFRVSGISHIVVLSGFNISILISFVLLLFSRLPLFLRVTGASLLVIIFVLMVGPEPSIIRAVCMSFISLLALTLGRKYQAKQALLISCICLILYAPESVLNDASFHLSFLATAGIVYAGEVCMSLFSRVSSKSYREIMGTTLAAYMATLPYIMWSFGTVSVYALITNFIVLPFIALIMLLSFLAIMMGMFIGTLGFAFGYLVTLFAGGIIFIARTVEGLPFSSFQVSVTFLEMICLYNCILFTGIFFAHSKKNETLLTKPSGSLSEIIPY